jgi:hypothetical protein
MLRFRHLALSLGLTFLLVIPALSQGMSAKLTVPGAPPTVIELKNEWEFWTNVRDFLKAPEEGTLSAELPGGAWSFTKKGDTVLSSRGGNPAEELPAKDLLAEVENLLKEGPLDRCQANLADSKIALTMWFVDHQDVYPASLDALAPSYLLQVLYCPISGVVPYKYEQLEGGKGFRLSCPSDHSPDQAPQVGNDKETEDLVRSAKPEE